MDWNEFGTAALGIVMPILGAVLVWIAAQVASAVKQKWGIDIDVARLQEDLNRALLEKKHAETIHSAAKTAASAIVMRDGPDAAKSPHAIREIIKYINTQGVATDAIAALSPLPDALDRIAIRGVTEVIAELRAGRLLGTRAG